MTTPYAVTYAAKYPLYVALWKAKRKGLDIYTLRYFASVAKRDILATLPLHSVEEAYTGQLYAELDAIRDTLLDAERPTRRQRKAA